MTNNSTALVRYATIPAPDYTTPAVELRSNRETYPHLSDIDRGDVLRIVKDYALAAFMIRGQKPDGQMLAVTAGILTDTLLADEKRIGTNALTVQELSRIFRDAAMEGDRPVSAACLYEAVERYVLGPGHDAEAESRRRLSKKTPALSPALARIDAAAAHFAKSHSIK